MRRLGVVLVTLAGLVSATPAVAYTLSRPTAKRAAARYAHRIGTIMARNDPNLGPLSYTGVLNCERATRRAFTCLIEIDFDLYSIGCTAGTVVQAVGRSHRVEVTTPRGASYCQAYPA